MIRNALVLANSKGGCGKTSLTAAISATMAAAGHKVLAVDLDTQGNLGRDLGYRNAEGDDKGQSLVGALGGFGDVAVVKDVRPGLDVIVGGEMLGDWPALAAGRQGRGQFPDASLYELLRTRAGDYDFIVIDTPPGIRELQRLGLVAADHLIVPVRTDSASVDGMEGLSSILKTIGDVNPTLGLLGVAVYGSSTSATRVHSKTRAQVIAAFGSSEPLFRTIVRYAEAPAVFARDAGLTFPEYAARTPSGAAAWAAIRAGKAPVYHPKSSGSLGQDMIDLVVEIMDRLDVARMPA